LIDSYVLLPDDLLSVLGPTVCVIDYEPNCTITVLHITNNLRGWRLFSATAELLFVFSVVR